jgi:hypothetical protein
MPPILRLAETFALSVAALLLFSFTGRALAQESGAAAGLTPGQLVGIWEGTTVASCNVSMLPDRCNAQQKVKLTVLQGANDKLTGNYKCSYGTQNCYHMNETGKIVDASITGKQVMMRVQMPDGMSCIFTGHNEGDRVNGGYTCYTGGSLLERGSWRAVRTD